MVKNDKFTTITLLMLIVIAYSIMPVTARFFSAFLTTYAYLAVAILTILSVFLVGRQKVLGEMFTVILPLLILNVLMYFAENSSIITWVYTLLLDILAVVLGIYALEYCGYKVIRILAFAIFIIYAITMLTTIIGLNEHPDAARYLATVADASEEEAVMYNWLNIGGFSFVYSVALIYPAVIYGFKHNKINIVFLIIFAVADFLLIINSGYTIALLLFITSTVFIFFRRDLKVKDVFIVLFIAVVVVAVLFPLVASLLEALADVVDNDTIAERLRDLAGGKEGLENSDDNRLDLYMTSLNSFLSHPLFGGIFEKVSMGGHSEILDKIAQYGLFGLVSYVLIYGAIYKKFFKPYRNKFGYGYVFWIFMQAVILMVLNPGMWLYELTLFIPVILMYIDGKGKKNENSLDSELRSQRVQYKTL